MRRLALVAAILGVGSVAHADRVHLTSGAVIDGRATRTGDKVVIEIESGALTVDASEVRLIESAESHLDHVIARRAALRQDDVQGRLALVRFCRDHGLSAHEAELLREVLDIAPDNAEARAALGYVKYEGVWLTRDDAMLAQGFVKYEGQWVTAEQRLALERLATDARLAELEREKAELELQAARANLEASGGSAAPSRTGQDGAQRSVMYYTPYVYGPGHHLHGRGHGHAHTHTHVQQAAPQRERPPPAPPRKPAAAKVGARDPRVR